jgi:hypothetical protein
MRTSRALPGAYVPVAGHAAAPVSSMDYEQREEFAGDRNEV